MERVYLLCMLSVHLKCRCILFLFCSNPMSFVRNGRKRFYKVMAVNEYAKHTGC